MRWVVSAKAVVFNEHGDVLLGLNDRGEWELPGGQLEAGEEPQDAVCREVLEETGLEVQAVSLLRAWVFNPVPFTEVLILSFGCRILRGGLRVSDEHESVKFHPLARMAELALPVGYQTDITLWEAAG